MFTSFENNSLAVVIGSTGGIGAAVLTQLHANSQAAHPVFAKAVGLSRSTVPALDLLDEGSIHACAQHIASLALPVRLVVDATGALHGHGLQPEKSWQQVNTAQMAQAFAVNAIGPALLMKHFLPLLPKSGKAVFASLSAKVGSIGDNRLGGWYSYRASKAALNQLVHTAAIELRRRAPEAICVVMHPGTVATDLSSPFAKTGLDVQTPAESANRMLRVIDGMTAKDSGGFFNHDGSELPW
jgi:NAD(P)-dependent dehydrogenase (short-subunit alcohol dehydrogenase family)